MDSKLLAQKIAALAAEVKATDIKVLDLRSLSSFTDFFVVCSGTSDRQLRAIADKVIDTLKKEGERPISKEGYDQGEWVLVDYADVVLHVFSVQARAHYDLEGFWNRAPMLKDKAKDKPKDKAKITAKAKNKKSKNKTSSKKPTQKTNIKKKKSSTSPRTSSRPGKGRPRSVGKGKTSSRLSSSKSKK